MYTFKGEQMFVFSSKKWHNGLAFFKSRAIIVPVAELGGQSKLRL